ncbi:MAG: hypothetical protein CMF04_09045 [Hyphomonas sp.]|nr:hypothetical protein [Hyphomonas sp.]
MSWTQPEVDLIKAEWAKGESASDVTRTLNRKFGTRRSRNATLGKLKRLGLLGRSAPARPVLPKHDRRRDSDPKEPKPCSQKTNKDLVRRLESKVKPKPSPAKKPEPEMWEPEGAFHLLDLNKHQCRWPVTEGDDHRFCGRTQTSGSSYCREHLKRSISPMSAATLQRAPVSMKKAMS